MSPASLEPTCRGDPQSVAFPHGESGAPGRIRLEPKQRKATPNGSPPAALSRSLGRKSAGGASRTSGGFLWLASPPYGATVPLHEFGGPHTESPPREPIGRWQGGLRPRQRRRPGSAHLCHSPGERGCRPLGLLPAQLARLCRLPVRAPLQDLPRLGPGPQPRRVRTPCSLPRARSQRAHTNPPLTSPEAESRSSGGGGCV